MTTAAFTGHDPTEEQMVALKDALAGFEVDELHYRASDNPNLRALASLGLALVEHDRPSHVDFIEYEKQFIAEAQRLIACPAGKCRRDDPAAWGRVNLAQALGYPVLVILHDEVLG